MIRAVLVALMFACLAMPGTARSADDSFDEIVVEGLRETELREFVAAMTDPVRTRQIARWDREICPTVLGIETHQAEFMARRIGEVATTVRLQVATSGCVSTMLVVVTPDASALATSLARDYPVTLRKDGDWRLKRFAASNRPVRWLTLTDPCGPQGCVLSGSRLTASTNPRFEAMIVLVDAPQVRRFNLGEVSDYVAFVVLGNPPLGGQAPATSILSMFERERPAESSFRLTDHDRTYLAGLYRTRTDGLGKQQRSAIANYMDK